MMTRVYLLRHAETANPSVFHGAESDIGLSTKGMQQADIVASVLARMGLDAVISSGMRRARDTAAPIARACNLSLQVEPDLHERKVSIMSGMPFDCHGGLWQETLRRWMAKDTHYAHEGAESFDALAARLIPVWQRVTQEHAGKTLAIVAHGIVCKVLLLSLVLGWDVSDWQNISSVNHAALTELVSEDGVWRTLSVNIWPAELVAAGLT